MENKSKPTNWELFSEKLPLDHDVIANTERREYRVSKHTIFLVYPMFSLFFMTIFAIPILALVYPDTSVSSIDTNWSGILPPTLLFGVFILMFNYNKNPSFIFDRKKGVFWQNRNERIFANSPPQDYYKIKEIEALDIVKSYREFDNILQKYYYHLRIVSTDKKHIIVYSSFGESTVLNESHALSAFLGKPIIGDNQPYLIIGTVIPMKNKPS